MTNLIEQIKDGLYFQNVFGRLTVRKHDIPNTAMFITGTE